MITNSIPKLLQEAGEVRQALAAIGEVLPAEISAVEMEAKISDLEAVIAEMDANSADRTRLVDLKKDKARIVSDYVVQSRSVVKGIYGADSYQYDMVGGTRTSERSRPKRKDKPTA